MFQEGKVICTSCGKHHEFHEWNANGRKCLRCENEHSFRDKWWYGLPVSSLIAGKVLKNGLRIVPEFFVEVRAFLNPHPDGDSRSSWTDAIQWFQRQGWTVFDNDVWYSFSRCRHRENGSEYYVKYNDE